MTITGQVVTISSAEVEPHAAQHASNGTDPVSPESIGAAPAYTYGTEDLTAGASPLATGTIYLVYE